MFLVVGRSERDTPVESDPVVEQHHLFKVIEKKLAHAFAVGHSSNCVRAALQNVREYDR